MAYQENLESLAERFPNFKKYSASEIARMEIHLQCVFPNQYKLLLQTLGTGLLFPSRQSAGIEIFDPMKIRSVFKDSFGEVDTWIGMRVMPVGWDEKLQEVAAYFWNRPAQANFFVVSHEYSLDDYWRYKDEDESTWTKSIADWIEEIAEKDGNLDVH